MSGGSRVDVSDVDRNTILSASDDNGNIADHTKGDEDNKVLIIEYGDFQCPGCGDAHPVLDEVVDKYQDHVTFVFRNFPLPGHPNARAAAATAEAAGLQGKYWEMHDRLFETQAAWSSLSGATRTDMFTQYANDLGLDREKFLEDLESDAVMKKINFDRALGSKAGVTGTPSIFVNGEEADGYYKDGELIAQRTEGANPVWSNAEAFETLIVLPALKEAGVEVEQE